MAFKWMPALVLASAGLFSLQAQAGLSCQALGSMIDDVELLTRDSYDAAYFTATDGVALDEFVTNVYGVVNREVNPTLDSAARRLASSWMRMDGDTYADALNAISKELISIFNKGC